MKTSREIRQEFLDFFEEKEHRVVPSSPVFPQDDPTLLFTNAGMNQFKDVFLGTGKRDYSRVADTQKCIRVSGKHNDLDEVGVDTYHHTFFEMLGNWSFGDYFKKEAIQWAWELLVERWGLDPERMYATVFGGDEEDGLPADEEAENLWLELTDLPPERVLKFGREDNFWEMGDTGPCGPCTEIHYDLGEGIDLEFDKSGKPHAVNADSPRFVEIWNLVFIQFNRTSDGQLHSLPSQHVDTGMGFERVVAVLQDVNSNYDTDIFQPIIEKISSLVGQKYGKDRDTDIAMRVIADHIRALSISFADGALPGNSGRGYVLRRILRRAARYLRQTLKVEEPVLYKIVPTVADTFEGVFPEVKNRLDHIQLLVKTEEEAFGRTIDKGIAIFEEVVENLKSGKKKKKVIPGDVAYDLYSTYGFPRDLTELMAREQGLSVDIKGWCEAEKKHQAESKGENKFQFDASELEGLSATEFTGYDRGKKGREVKTKIVKLIGTEEIILEKTPFYAESGGQVGDTGTITAKGFHFDVHDTQKHGDIYVHYGELKEGDLTKLPSKVTAKIDYERRQAIMANHTATHLLHHALKEVFGNSANQAGSLVAPDRLRFDVTIPRRVESSEVARLEDMVNEKIIANDGTSTSVEDLEKAKKRGAMALFGEKYADEVRVVSVGDYSLELCGGTHVKSTGEIGSFVITQEQSLSTGVRRIEAVTRDEAVRQIQAQKEALGKLSQLLSVPTEKIYDRVEKMQEELKELKREQKKNSEVLLQAQANQLLSKATQEGDLKIVAQEVEVGPGDLQMLADGLTGTHQLVAGVVACRHGGKAHIITFVSKKVVNDKLNANLLMKKISPIVGGKGGGRPDRARGGGTEPDKLPEAIRQAEEYIREHI